MFRVSSHSTDIYSDDVLCKAMGRCKDDSRDVLPFCHYHVRVIELSECFHFNRNDPLYHSFFYSSTIHLTLDS